MPASAFRIPRHRLVVLTAGAAFAAFLLGWIAFAIHRGDLAAAHYAANTVLGASCLAFVLYFVSGPLSRHIVSNATSTLGRQSRAIASVFAGAYAMFLFWVVAPHIVMRTGVPLPTAAFCLLSAAVLVVFAAGACSNRFSSTASGRTLQRLANGYFWFVLTVNYIDHAIGPHRPEYFHNVALGLLVLALVIRVADGFVRKFNTAMPERTL